MDIESWLRGLGLEHYATTFRDNDVDEHVLPSLKAQDLREMGVASVGHRRRLLDAIATLDGREFVSTAGPWQHVPAKVDRSERRQLTVMFVDLVGSTALSGGDAGGIAQLSEYGRRRDLTLRGTRGKVHGRWSAGLFWLAQSP